MPLSTTSRGPLGNEDKCSVERPNGTKTLLDHRTERLVQQCPPSLIHRDQQRLAIQLHLDAMEQIEQRRASGAGIV